MSPCLYFTHLTDSDNKKLWSIFFLTISLPDPRMSEQLPHDNPVPWPDPQAASDQVLAMIRNIASEDQVSIADLIICFKRNVPTDHVIQQDAQGPHSGLVAKVPGAPDPLGRRIHSCALKFCIMFIFGESS